MSHHDNTSNSFGSTGTCTNSIPDSSDCLLVDLNHQYSGNSQAHSELDAKSSRERSEQVQAPYICTAPSKCQERRRHSVRFLPTIKARIIESIDYYSAEEQKASWYGKEELVDLQEEYKSDIKLMRRRNRDGVTTTFDEDFTTRGIEHLRSSSVYKHHLQEQENATASVMLAQSQKYSSQQVAIVYAHYCKESQERAINSATIDAAEARLLLLS